MVFKGKDLLKQADHLSVMTPGALPMSRSISFLQDFTTGTAYSTQPGTDVQKPLGQGVFGLYQGDFDQSASIDAADRSLAWNTRNQIGYLVLDCNFDAVCDAKERSKVWNNRNKLSQVP